MDSTTGSQMGPARSTRNQSGGQDFAEQLQQCRFTPDVVADMNLSQHVPPISMEDPHPSITRLAALPSVGRNSDPQPTDVCRPLAN